MNMRNVVVASVFALSACGDDSGVSDGSSTGDGTGSTSSPTTVGATTSGAQTSDATSSTGGAGSSSGGADSTGADSTGGSATGSDSGSGTDAGDSGTSGGMAAACPAADVLAAIDQHAHDLVTTAGLLAGHPSASEATGFLLAPALPSPPAISSIFAGPLIMPCSTPLTYDAYCADGACSQIECTGDGAGWIMHFWLPAPLVSGGWTFDEVTVDVAWADGAPGVTFDIGAVSTAPNGEDMTMVGSGAMDQAGMTVTEVWANLDPAGPTTLEYTDGAAFSGDLTIDTTVAATVDPAGHLVPTGDCP